MFVRARRVGDLREPQEPATPDPVPIPKNPVESVLGANPREHESRILYFLTGSAHVILPLPSGLCPGIQS
jgi:hypothetical protein